MAYLNVDHTLDPKGDVILILRNASAPFAVWDPQHNYPHELDTEEAEALEKAEKKRRYKQDSLGTGETDVSDDEEETRTGHKPGDEITYRLSSRHLILASEYFQKMFEGPWSGSLHPMTFESPRVVHAEDWDAEALLILFRILHCKASEVPRQMSVESMAKFALLVDFYQCHKAVEVYAELWLMGLPHRLNVYSRELILQLWMSQVFPDAENSVFVHGVHRVMLEHCRGPIQTLGLPIPMALINKIEFCRQQLFEYALGRIKALIDTQCKGIADARHSCIRHGNCQPLCGSDYRESLGTICEKLNELGMLLKRPETPFLGKSWRECAKILSPTGPTLKKRSYRKFETESEVELDVDANLGEVIHRVDKRLERISLTEWISSTGTPGIVQGRRSGLEDLSTSESSLE